MSNFNKLTVMSAIAFCISVPTAFSGANDPLPGPTYDAPLTENWAPSKYWGAGDKAGSANHMKNPANIKRALATVKQFKAISIGKYYHREAPAFGPRGWNMTIPGTPTGGPFGANALFYHDEMVTTEIGQIQTQFDGPGHIGVNTSKGMYMYNGFNPMSENGYERGAGGRVVGMGDAGVEHVAETGFVCRLVVLDAVAYKKKIGQISAAAEMLPIPKSSADVGGIVTAGEIDGILKMQGLDPIGSGDCVALHTGQGNTWSNDRYKSMSSEERAAARAIFAQGEPGFGYSACSYFGERNIALTMGDTSANDAQPGNEVEGWAVPCHTELQVKYGTWNLENVDTKSLVDNKIYEGAFIWSPLRIIGATGSPGKHTGITLSNEQRIWAEQLMRREELSERCTIELRDYRDVTGIFDGIVSIEMIEAVGKDYWITFFETISTLLKPGGRAVIQAITIDEHLFNEYESGVDFIQTYIFPGGMLMTKNHFYDFATKANLTVSDALEFGQDYASTLLQWHDRFITNWLTIKDLGFDNRFKNMWEFYLAYCRSGFLNKNIDVVQFTLTKAQNH